MKDEFELRVIARLRGDFTTKFGIPRQSGLAPEQRSTIVFEPDFRDANALRGLEGYSHIWLLWGFSELERDKDSWSPMVKPPRLGGNTRMGVFATRSPNRPNPIGLSSVELKGIESVKGMGIVLHVAGADLMDGTPIYDIKPYLAFTDSHPQAVSGFAGDKLGYSLKVTFPDELIDMIPAEKREALISALAQDPRPAYRNDPEELFGFEFAGLDIRFRVDGDALTVAEIAKAGAKPVK